MEDYELLFLKSLALTVLIEALVIFLYFRYVDKQKQLETSKLLITGFITSFATLPYLWFVLPVFVDQQIWYVIIGESFAVLAETFIIGVVLRIGFGKAFFCSLACNIISFSIGWLINWP